MIPVLHKFLHQKTQLLYFKIMSSHKFLACGRKSCLKSPFRLDNPKFIEIGSNTCIQERSWLYATRRIDKMPSLKIGSDCIFGFSNHIVAACSVYIEDKVLTANNVYISDNIHEYENIEIPIMDQPIKFKKAVRIGSGSWLGENVCVIGACVGKNSVIGANSVVTKDIPNFSLAVGAPARVVKSFNKVTKKWESHFEA